ncbi:MAG: hypothetical protein BA874_07110 [Desulfuromonadales bacterium C00003068]|jgi:cell fate regulator YaaT (PSP1 superfamily)|nr:MAG: hypothetical protein BA874_07110 [Desulfuromonadales bacterium C00003068]
MTTDTILPETPVNDEGKILVTVKFRSAGKQYDFDTNALELSLNDEVVVETTRGRALGTIVRENRIVSKPDLPSDLKKVLRIATEADLNMARISASKEKEALDYCFDRIRQRKMPMKLVKAEYLFDGSKIIFYFTAEGRVDFRELVKDLAQYFHTRIEMRQIGVRDEAKLIGGIGICGRELCCGTFLTDFHPVSVRMAKQQGLALNPTKISGQCGRLLCCLGYEYDTYCTMAKNLPKQGTKVSVNGKDAEVLSAQTLAQTVTVRSEGKVVTNIPMSKLSSCKCPQAKANQTESNTTKSDDKHSSENQKPSRNNPKGQNRGDNRPNRAQKGSKSREENATGKTNEPRQQRPNRNKPQNARPAKDAAANKANADQRPSRPQKEGQQKQEGQTARPQRPQRPQRQRTNKKPQSPTERNQNRDQGQEKAGSTQLNQEGAQPALDENGETKSIKRRSRNRRRPPRKP